MPLKKEVVDRANKEEPPKEHNIGVLKTNELTDIKQLPIIAPLDSKNWSDELEIESFVKTNKFNKTIPLKKEMTPPDNSKTFPPIKTFSSSSSCSSIVEDLSAFTENSEFTEKSRASSEMSAETEIFKEAEKPAKSIVSESCINVSF